MHARFLLSWGESMSTPSQDSWQLWKRQLHPLLSECWPFEGLMGYILLSFCMWSSCWGQQEFGVKNDIGTWAIMFTAAEQTIGKESNTKHQFSLITLQIHFLKNFYHLLCKLNPESQILSRCKSASLQQSYRSKVNKVRSMNSTVLCRFTSAKDLA